MYLAYWGGEGSVCECWHLYRWEPQQSPSGLRGSPFLWDPQPCSGKWGKYSLEGRAQRIQFWGGSNRRIRGALRERAGGLPAVGHHSQQVTVRKGLSTGGTQRKAAVRAITATFKLLAFVTHGLISFSLPQEQVSSGLHWRVSHV